MKARPHISIARPLPLFIAAGAANSSTTDLDLNIPAGFQLNDILIAVIECETGESFTQPSGWAPVTGSPVTSPSGGSASTRLHVAWKRATGAESSPITFVRVLTPDHLFGQMFAFRFCFETGNPWTGTPGTGSAAPATAITVPSTTPTADNSLIIAAISTSFDGNGTSEFTDPPGGWVNANLTSIVEIADRTFSLSNGGGFGVAYGYKRIAGATGTWAATAANSVDHAYMSIALRPKQ